MLAPRRPSGYEIDWNAVGSFAVVAIFVLALGGVWAFLAWERRRRVRHIAKQEKIRWDGLCQRFGPEIAGRIWRRELWLGMSPEMVREIHGPPVAIEEQVSASRVRHIMKYRHMGGLRFGLRINVEDGAVVGWEDK